MIYWMMDDQLTGKQGGIDLIIYWMAKWFGWEEGVSSHWFMVWGGAVPANGPAYGIWLFDQ
jgi:hypothetical protein